jgi:hypothetical protein
VQRRRQPEKDAGQERKCESERNHTGVEMHFVQPRQIGGHQSEQRFPGERQDRDCGHAAGQRQQDALGQQLPH